jgi:6-phosphogluconolactonase
MPTFPDRRTVLAGLTATLAAPALAAPRGSTPLFAGNYTGEGGPGATPLTRTAATWRLGTPIPTVANASWTIDAGNGMRYVVDERANGQVHLCDRDLRIVASAASGGADPCHLALHPGGRWLAAANYSSGTIGLLPLVPGRPTLGPPVIRRHAGSGPNAARQAGPHAHWVGFTPDGRWLHAVDLGADAIFAHDLRGGPGATHVAFAAPAGSGPRHLGWHPSRRRAYLVTELSAELIVLDARADGDFAAVATLALRPSGFAGGCYPAHVAIDAAARRLYVSLRGPDLILTFALDDRGMPTAIGSMPSGGRWPRCFTLTADGRQLLVANQRSGEIAVLTIGATGKVSGVEARLPVRGVAFVG